MYDVIEIREIQDLDEYRSAWKSLLDATPRPNFFLTLDWLEVYWRFYGHEQKLRVLITLHDGQPTGIVPLTVKTEARLAGKLRCLTFPLAYWVHSTAPSGLIQKDR